MIPSASALLTVCALCVRLAAAVALLGLWGCFGHDDDGPWKREKQIISSVGSSDTTHLVIGDTPPTDPRAQRLAALLTALCPTSRVTRDGFDCRGEQECVDSPITTLAYEHRVVRQCRRRGGDVVARFDRVKRLAVTAAGCLVVERDDDGAVDGAGPARQQMCSTRGDAAAAARALAEITGASFDAGSSG